MKNVKQMAAQGDVIFIRRDHVPDGFTKQKGKKHIIAHSETGHHHVAMGGSLYKNPQDAMVSFLSINKDTKIEHHREWDTHETLKLLNDAEGETVWEIRRQREHTPEGWRRVED